MVKRDKIRKNRKGRVKMEYGNWEYRFLPVEQIPKTIINCITEKNTEQCFVTPKACISNQHKNTINYTVICERVQPLSNFKTNLCVFVCFINIDKPNIISGMHFKVIDE